MRTCIIIVGLPGSGKSYLLNQYKNTHLIIDDFQGSWEEFKQIVMDNVERNIAIADPHFCLKSARDKLERFLSSLDFKLEWIYFENNVEKCRKNVHYRNDGREVYETIKYYSGWYKVPDGIMPRMIWEAK